MYIIPAIDLRSGKCVRLIQGQYHRQITYEDSPAKQAEKFVADGSDWVHIVDLDGARIGSPVNVDAIKSIIKTGKLKSELGGGIRDEESIRQMLDLGIERVIIGTKAVSDFDWFAQMAEKFPARIALGLDARGSKVATHGWMQNSPQELIDFAIKASKLPLAVIIYTDIDKDGMLAGPNFDRTRAVVKAVKVPVIASGGVTTMGDIENLVETGADGAIVGRALYEGTFNLAEAIKTLK